MTLPQLGPVSVVHEFPCRCGRILSAELNDSGRSAIWVGCPVCFEYHRASLKKDGVIVETKEEWLKRENQTP